MSLLSGVNATFKHSRRSSSFRSAFDRWRRKHASLTRFSNVEELIDFCRQPEPSLYDEKNEIYAGLCGEASAGCAEAALLLVWLFKGALWRIAREIGECLLDPDELDAELLAGFWEGAANDPCSERLSGRLVARARQRAWSAVARARRDASRLADADVDIPDPTPFVDNPSIVIDRALSEGVVSEIGAELIQATRLEGQSLRRVADRLGLDSEESVRKRRNRAERKLAAWLLEEPGVSRDTVSQRFAPESGTSS